MRPWILLAFVAACAVREPTATEAPPLAEPVPEPAPAPLTPAEPAPPAPETERLPDFQRLEWGMKPEDAMPPEPGQPRALGSARPFVHDAPIGYLVIEPPDRCYKVWIDARREAPMEWRREHGSQGPIYVVPGCGEATPPCGVRTTCPAFAEPVLDTLRAEAG